MVEIELYLPHLWNYTLAVTLENDCKILKIHLEKFIHHNYCFKLFKDQDVHVGC